MDAFDADVLIYAAVEGHELGRRVRVLFPAEPIGKGESARVGSVLLIPELLAKPLRERRDDELEALTTLLSRLDPRPGDEMTAAVVAALVSTYRLRWADAVHLATAVSAGADRFITNSRADFRPAIAEIDVIYPQDLPDPLMRRRR